jgi:sulfite exporter TauE/SafE
MEGSKMVAETDTSSRDMAGAHHAAERAISAGVAVRRLAIVVAVLWLMGLVLSGVTMVANEGSAGSGAYLIVVFGPITVAVLYAVGCITEIHGHSLRHALAARCE